MNMRASEIRFKDTKQLERMQMNAVGLPDHFSKHVSQHASEIDSEAIEQFANERNSALKLILCGI